MRIGIFSFRAFDRRLARLAAPISSGVRQGAEYPPPPAGRVRLNTPAGRGGLRFFKLSVDFLQVTQYFLLEKVTSITSIT